MGACVLFFRGGTAVYHGFTFPRFYHVMRHSIVQEDNQYHVPSEWLNNVHKETGKLVIRCMERVKIEVCNKVILFCFLIAHFSTSYSVPTGMPTIIRRTYLSRDFWTNRQHLLRSRARILQTSHEQVIFLGSRYLVINVTLVLQKIQNCVGAMILWHKKLHASFLCANKIEFFMRSWHKIKNIHLRVNSTNYFTK